RSEDKFSPIFDVTACRGEPNVRNDSGVGSRSTEPISWSLMSCATKSNSTCYAAQLSSRSMGSPSQMKCDPPVALRDRSTVRAWLEQFQIADWGRGCRHALGAAGRTHKVWFCAVLVMPAGWHGCWSQLGRLAPPGLPRRAGTR